MNSADSGTVHSVFARAVNLMIGGDMWTVLATEKTDRPFGIRVTLPSFDSLDLHSGDPVNIRAGYLGIGSRLVIDCRAAVRWKPARGNKPERGLEHRIALVAAAAGDRSWCESAPMALAVRIAFDESPMLDGVIAKVVGRGPGATPAGDDVLVGILAVLTSPYAGVVGAKAAKLLSRSILPVLPTTTEVSGHLIRQATNGLFGRDIHDLVSTLIGGSSPEQFRENLRRIVATGATSGADMCQGLLAFAPHFFTNDMETASA